MKSILMVICLFAYANAFATAQVDYQCENYTYEIFGAVYSQLWDESGNLLGRWEGEDKNTPMFELNGEQYIRWDGRDILCVASETTP